MNDDVSTDIDFSDDIADSENVLYKQHQESLEKNDVNTPIIDEVVNTDSIKQPKKMIIDYLDKDEMDQKIHQIHSLTEDFIIALDHKNAARIVGSSKSMTPTLFQAPSQFFLQTLDTSKTSLFFQQRKSILIELIQKNDPLQYQRIVDEVFSQNKRLSTKLPQNSLVQTKVLKADFFMSHGDHSGYPLITTDQ